MSASLAAKLEGLGRPRIIVVGDLIVDTDLHGTCERYAQESPGCPVFRVDRKESRPGGAGAVAGMARMLGAEVQLICGNASEKRRYFVEGRQLWRADEDTSTDLPPVDGNEAANLPARIRDAVREADAVLVADYGKGICTDAVLRAAIVISEMRNIPCIVDPHRNPDWRRYRGATAIKCNDAEWEVAFEEHEMHLRKSCGWWEKLTTNVIVTDGAAGMTWFPRKASALKFAARPRNVADVIGSGDMVLACLGVCIAGGLDWPDACRIANAAAGLKVERHGAVPVPRAEVVADLLAVASLPA